MPDTHRDARNLPALDKQDGSSRPLEAIQPARNFAKSSYVEYDLSKMTDTKGGFLTVEDDPHNKALHAPSGEEKPAHMTLQEWERHQVLKKLRESKSGPFEPGVSIVKERNATCQECESLEVDYQWLEVLKCAVCNACKEKLPEKYSLLTKTEAKEDYMLTDPELKDIELLPHIERPNPHKSTWNNMMLFLKYHLEEVAIKKWGSLEKMDEEYQKREEEKKRKKNVKFQKKIQEIKKRTRVDAFRRSKLVGGGGGNFGDDLSNGDKHTHVWGRAIIDENGIGKKNCVECGMEVEEIEF